MAVDRRITPELVRGWLGTKSQDLTSEELIEFADFVDAALGLYVGDEVFGFGPAGVASRELEEAIEGALKKQTPLKRSKAARVFSEYPDGAKRLLRMRAVAQRIRMPTPEDIQNAASSRDACSTLLSLLVYGHNCKISLRYAPHDGDNKDAHRALIGALGANWNRFLAAEHGQAARYAQRETPTSFMIFCAAVFAWIWPLNKAESGARELGSRDMPATKDNIQNLVHSAIERGFLLKKNST